MAQKMMSQEELLAGLKPALESHARGMLYQETTLTFASKLEDCFRTRLKIVEVDRILVIPKIARNYVGADDLIAKIYFAVSQNTQNIYYRGKGNKNRGNSGRINMVQAAGYGNGGGVFGFTDEFKQVMAPFCKTDNNRKALLNLKTVQNHGGVASLEVDFWALLFLFLGIESDDPYDCDVLRVDLIQGSDNVYNMLFAKYIYQGGQKRGKTGINYDKISADQFAQVNGRGGRNNDNGGGRSY